MPQSASKVEQRSWQSLPHRKPARKTTHLQLKSRPDPGIAIQRGRAGLETTGFYERAVNLINSRVSSATEATGLFL